MDLECNEMKRGVYWKKGEEDVRAEDEESNEDSN